MPIRELHRAPATLPLLARAAAPMVPGASRLPFVAGRGDRLPDTELVLRDAEIDRERLGRYARLCGFSGAGVPATYPHVLAFPLHLALMTDGSFPFGAIGLVHVANRIVQHRPIDAGDRLELRVRAGELAPHPKGRTFSLLTEARVGGELVWEDVSTMLRRGGGGGGERGGTDGARDVEVTEEWELAGDLGRRYADVSGDRNPIHLHPLTARLFGFPRAIAHGMWTKARCLAALGDELPESFEVEVAFRRPILLPATVAFGVGGSGRTTRFAVRDARKGTAHLDGTLSATTKAKGAR